MEKNVGIRLVWQKDGSNKEWGNKERQNQGMGETKKSKGKEEMKRTQNLE